jgi:hypothetical protein
MIGVSAASLLHSNATIIISAINSTYDAKAV